MSVRPESVFYLGDHDRYDNPWHSVAVCIQFRQVMKDAYFNREAEGMATYQGGLKPFTVEMSQWLKFRETANQDGS